MWADEDTMSTSVNASATVRLNTSGQLSYVSDERFKRNIVETTE
jgi:hypothetical protein